MATSARMSRYDVPSAVRHTLRMFARTLYSAQGRSCGHALEEALHFSWRTLAWGHRGS